MQEFRGAGLGGLEERADRDVLLEEPLEVPDQLLLLDHELSTHLDLLLICEVKLEEVLQKIQVVLRKEGFSAEDVLDLLLKPREGLEGFDD